jgi:hypothetical protein
VHLVSFRLPDRTQQKALVKLIQAPTRTVQANIVRGLHQVVASRVVGGRDPSIQRASLI